MFGAPELDATLSSLWLPVHPPPPELPPTVFSGWGCRSSSRRWPQPRVNTPLKAARKTMEPTPLSELQIDGFLQHI